MIIIIVFIHHIKVETIFTRGVSHYLCYAGYWIWLKCICTCGLLHTYYARMHACGYMSVQAQA